MICYYGWKTGSRHVVVLGPLTFKFPKLWIRRFSQAIFGIQGLDYNFGWLALRQALSVSFGENFTEAKWFFKKKPPYIVPCVLPLVLVNVYPTAHGVGALKVQEYLYYAYKTTGGKEWPAGFSSEFRKAFSSGPVSHTLEHEDNYALHRGEVKLLDYGASGVMELVVNHQEEFAKFLREARKYSTN